MRVNKGWFKKGFDGRRKNPNKGQFRSGFDGRRHPLTTEERRRGGIRTARKGLAQWEREQFGWSRDFGEGEPQPV